MAKRKQNDGLYAFLDRQGVLATGDHALIQEAKRQYWAAYKREWKKQKRKQSKSFTVYFTGKESGGIRKAAEFQSVSPTKFIKRAALAMAGKGSITDSALLGKVRERFGLSLTNIENHMNSADIPLDTIDPILEGLEQLEEQILNLITHVKPEG